MFRISQQLIQQILSPFARPVAITQTLQLFKTQHSVKINNISLNLTFFRYRNYYKT